MADVRDALEQLPAVGVYQGRVTLVTKGLPPLPLAVQGQLAVITLQKKSVTAPLTAPLPTGPAGREYRGMSPKAPQGARPKAGRWAHELNDALGPRVGCTVCGGRELWLLDLPKLGMRRVAEALDPALLVGGDGAPSKAMERRRAAALQLLHAQRMYPWGW